MRGSREEGQGVRTTLENHKNIGFLSNTGPGPLKNHKIQNSMLGHHRFASETPFKLRFAGGPMIAPLKWYLDPLYIKNVVKVGPPLTKVSGSALESSVLRKLYYLYSCVV